jgi:hypothetical protein
MSSLCFLIRLQFTASLVRIATNAVQKLMSELSVYRRSPELKARADTIWMAERKLDRATVVEERKRRNYDSFWMPVPAIEPFRCVLAQVCNIDMRPPQDVLLHDLQALNTASAIWSAGPHARIQSLHALIVLSSLTAPWIGVLWGCC